MKKSIRRATMAALISAASAMVVAEFVPSDAYAGQRGRQEATKQSGTQTRASVGRPLNDAMKLVDAKDFAGAMAKVREADAVANKTPFEEFMVAKYMGFIAINQPMPDYAVATQAYNRQITSGGSPQEEKAVIYNVAMKLNYQAMDYQKVIENAAQLQMLEPLDDTGHLVLIQSHYNLNDFPSAIAAAKNQIALRAAAGMGPTEDVLGLLLNAQIKSMDDAGARQTLEQLASVSARPEVWSQVIGFALGSQGITDHQILNLYRLSVLTGTMTDTDYLAMATIDLQNGLPAEAKKVLTDGNKPGELLTQANQFLTRDQRDLPALAAEAVKDASGEIDIKLGESYYTYGRLDEAVAAIQRGIQKGRLKDMADAQTTLGIVLMAAGRKDEALAAFDQAAAAGGAAGQVARLWSVYGRRATTAA